MIRIIAMLTHDDQTVENALEVYEASKQVKTPCWGFKDININAKDAKILSSHILRDKKEFYFESLVSSEEGALKIAKLAIECKADYLTSMEYFESVHELLKPTTVKFFPTCGRREGHPRRMLYGSIEEIIADANRIVMRGVDGICLSVFRYMDGDPIELAKRFVNEVDVPMVVSGSINSDERLDFIKEVKPWGFTIGSALFDSDFSLEKSVAEKLDYIYDYINS
ncbi:MAG: hypothetical protein KAW47_11050 [Thermoplasmatales archaeon]|nr:hypothetical protein [Thermoplasmatales archaeon]